MWLFLYLYQYIPTSFSPPLITLSQNSYKISWALWALWALWAVLRCPELFQTLSEMSWDIQRKNLRSYIIYADKQVPPFNLFPFLLSQLIFSFFSYSTAQDVSNNVSRLVNSLRLLSTHQIKYLVWLKGLWSFLKLLGAIKVVIS